MTAWVEHLHWERNLSEHTRRAYAGDLDDLAGWAARHGVGSWEQVDHRLLRAWLADLHRRGAERSTMARRAAAARMFFRWAQARGQTPTNPASALEAPRADRALPPTLDRGAAAAVFEYLESAVAAADSRARAVEEVRLAETVRAQRAEAALAEALAELAMRRKQNAYGHADDSPNHCHDGKLPHNAVVEGVDA